MKLTLDQALQKGIEAHKSGDTHKADRYYTTILSAQPNHPDANHNLGILAIGLGEAKKALPFLKTALETQPGIAQYWLSYIDTLIRLERIDEAKVAFDEVKSRGVKGDDFDKLEKILTDIGNIAELDSTTNNRQDPTEDHLQSLIKLYTQGSYQKVQTKASKLIRQFPMSINLYNIMGAASKRLGNTVEAIESFKKAIEIKPDFAEGYNNIGIALTEQGNLEEAIDAFNRALEIKPNYAEAHNNMGIALKNQGSLEEAIKAYNKALEIKRDFAEAYSNIGVALTEQGNLERAIDAFNRALEIKPNYAEVYWNLSGTAKNINAAKRSINKCLEFDPQHLKAKLMLSALQYYEGNTDNFNTLNKSPLKDHAQMRSFNWVFNLPKLPVLLFSRWALYDQMIELSKKNRPFYEFGVWRGKSFEYFLKTFKKGYGFDTFSGLPEAWHDEKVGSYSSCGNVPRTDGGEFIIGEFKNTLPSFFEKSRPKASIINFDADLYSSTICALNHAKPLIDKHTILIFDEFIINENWEQDEYRALKEFCAKNQYKYEVLAISFYSKQVALKINGF